ncbi:MAG TPA: hypothetical protein VJ300_01370 [Thermoplasmata archaeon]|nr:hypothetical protein [Thermoplasmata archaeon]
MDPDTATTAEDTVLGYARIEFDLRSAVASLRPGESLKVRPGEVARTVPILAVEDDSWRLGLDP